MRAGTLILRVVIVVFLDGAALCRRAVHVMNSKTTVLYDPLFSGTLGLLALPVNIAS